MAAEYSIRHRSTTTFTLARNPVGNTDPSGHELSTTQLVVGTGILGAVVGFSVGAVTAAQETGEWISMKTLWYGLYDASIGFGLGALLGYGIALVFVGPGAASGIGAQLPTMFSKIWRSFRLLPGDS